MIVIIIIIIIAIVIMEINIIIITTIVISMLLVIQKFNMIHLLGGLYVGYSGEDAHPQHIKDINSGIKQ